MAFWQLICFYFVWGTMTSVGYGAWPFLVLLSRLGEPRAKLFKILLTDIYFSSSCLPGDIYATTEEERVRFADLSPDFLGHAAGSESKHF